MTAITLKNIEKSFKPNITKPPTKILKDLSFSVRSEKITGFLGANGSGKTTTFKTILGLIFPDKGSIHFFKEESLNNQVKEKIGFMPERPQFPDYLSGEEFLLYYLKLHKNIEGRLAKDLVHAALKKVHLFETRHRYLRNYSKGMIQRAGIAQAIIHEPEIVILDEPMSGLDPDGRYEVSQLILDIYKSGKTIFFSSHLLDDVQKLCDDLVILKDGKCLFEGSKVTFMEKFKALFRITYLQNDKSEVVEIESIDALNQAIDALRKQGCHIIEVNTKNTLEQAYVSFQRGEV